MLMRYHVLQIVFWKRSFKERAETSLAAYTAGEDRYRKYRRCQDDRDPFHSPDFFEELYISESFRQFLRRYALVMGPTPPGTGVMNEVLGATLS